MLLNKNENIEIHRIDSEESFRELSEGTVWNIPKHEYENETIIVIKSPNKRRGLRIERALYFDENNNLFELDKLIQSYTKSTQEKLKEIMEDVSIKFLSNEIKNKTLDYNKIKDDSIVIIQNPEEAYDINFLITVRGRREFAQPMFDSFKVAAEKSPLSITYTIIEHSENPEHSKFCKKNKLNYIWIKSNPGELFNKCLSYNMGVFFGNKSKYVLFHDIDCLVQSDFFLKLFDNISHKQCRAIQCFTGRRVLYINEAFTPKVIAGEFLVDDLNIDMPEVDYPRLGGKIMIGAPGGSILVERELYFEVGGYDAELFLANSPEDAFFWEKIDTIDKMHVSDEPDIELYHMYHPPTWMNNPHVHEMQAINNKFKALNVDNKKKIILYKSEMIKEFK